MVRYFIYQYVIFSFKPSIYLPFNFFSHKTVHGSTTFINQTRSSFLLFLYSCTINVNRKIPETVLFFIVFASCSYKIYMFYLLKQFKYLGLAQHGCRQGGLREFLHKQTIVSPESVLCKYLLKVVFFNLFYIKAQNYYYILAFI